MEAAAVKKQQMSATSEVRLRKPYATPTDTLSPGWGLAGHDGSDSGAPFFSSGWVSSYPLERGGVGEIVLGPSKLAGRDGSW